MINEILLIGTVGRDAEVRDVSGTKVATFSLATEENYKEGNEWKTVTTWHKIVCWRGLAEQAEKSAQKGNLLYVSGKITYRTYKDKDGNEKSTAEIVANQMRTLRRKEQTDQPVQKYSSQSSQFSNDNSLDPQPNDLPF